MRSSSLNIGRALTRFPPNAEPTSSIGVETNEDGLLLLGALTKGVYRLTETEAANGYVIGDEPFQATFVIEDGDEEKTFDFTKDADRKDANFTVVSGNFDD